MAVSGTRSEESAAENGADVAMRLKGCGIVLLVLFIAIAGVIVVPPLLVPRQYTELLDAARDGDIQAIDRLLDAGVDVNAAYYEGLGPYFEGIGPHRLSRRATQNTALVIAARYGKLVAVDHLLDRGANPWIWNSNSVSAFDHMLLLLLGACDCAPHGAKRVYEGGDSECERLKRCAEVRSVYAKLVLKGLDLSKNERRAAFWLPRSAVYSGDAELVRKAASKVPGKVYQEGLLTYAAARGLNAIVAEMVQHISDVPQLSRAAASAITYGQADVALLLIDRGVAVDTQDRTGWTLLHVVASQGDATSVRQLLQRGARTDIRDKSNKLPIDYANDETVRRLLTQTQ